MSEEQKPEDVNVESNLEAVREIGKFLKEEEKKSRIRIFFHDGTSETIFGEAVRIGLDGYTNSVLRVSNIKDDRLVVAYPIGVVHSWQIISPSYPDRVVRHPAPAGVRYIRKATGLAGEVPVGTVVAWAGTGDVPCGWQAYEWDKK